MINLLPSEVKKQIAFARYNVVVIRYMVLAIIVATFLSLIMIAGVFFAKREITALEEELQDKEALVGNLRQIELEARGFESELETVEKLFEQESKFSVFIGELASVIPPWAKLISIQLTRPDPPKTSVTINEDGEPITTLIPSTNDGKTLDISFNVRNNNDAAVIRKNLLEVPRIEFVDVQNIATTEVDNKTITTVAIRLALKESPDKVYTAPEEQAQ